MPTPTIRITPYTAKHQQGVVDLVLGIQQREFGIPISLADQPDLLTIETFYQSKRGGFWCALTETGHVVGTISLIDVGEAFGTIRKMFVHADFRGRELALAALLLQTLEDHASAVGLKTIYLGTLDILAAAQRFYAKNGYQPVDIADLPSAFPRMRLDNRFFGKALGKSV